jgi:hypothetical protein
MTKTILWSSARESFDDGVYRRRVAIPSAGLRGLGWRAAGRDIGPKGARAAVLDGLAEGASPLAEALTAAGAPIVLDASRWICTARGDEAPASLVRIASLARVVVAPTGRLAEAAGEALGCAGKTAVIPDPVETAETLQLAAIGEGVDFRPAELAGETEDLVVWFAGPEDVVEAELEQLPTLAGQVRAAGLRLLALTPKSALARARSLIGSDAKAMVWTLEGQAAVLSGARACILPGPPGRAGWSVARRAALALALGTPVLAPSGPELDRASPTLILDDWAAGLALAVSGELARRAAARPPPHAAADTALEWDELLSQVSSGPRPRAAPVRLLMTLDLIQDAELCLPVLTEASRRSDVEPRVLATSWFARNAPAAMAAVEELGVPLQMVEREELLEGGGPPLEDLDAVLSVVATSLRAHRHSQAVVARARLAGVPSFSMQHGLENVGLTFFDELHSEEVEITSDYLFVWFPPDEAPPSPLELRRKFIHVGAVKSARPRGPKPPLPEGTGPVISVFENLHWHRYDLDYRQRFVADLGAAARAAPASRFVLKPHPAGMWSKGQTFEGFPANVLVIDPTDPAWASVTAQALIARSDRVITTPSTVALDAALASRPVAVVGYGLDLPVYAPLPVLRRGDDWLAFANAADRSWTGGDMLDAFLRRHLLRDEAAPNLLDALVDRVGALR